MLTKFRGRWEHDSLADGSPFPLQGLLVLSSKNHLVSGLEKLRHPTLVLVVRTYLGIRRSMFCLHI